MLYAILFVFGDGMKGSTSLARKQRTGPGNGLATAQELQFGLGSFDVFHPLFDDDHDGYYARVGV